MLLNPVLCSSETFSTDSWSFLRDRLSTHTSAQKYDVLVCMPHAVYSLLFCKDSDVHRCIHGVTFDDELFQETKKNLALVWL